MRHIDADLLLENLKKQYGEELGWQCTVNMSDVGMMIEDAPTADVVPKSEVERLQAEVSDLQDELYSEIETNKHLGAEYIALRKEKNALNIEIEALKIANEKMYSAIEGTKSEVAREIFEEIEKVRMQHTFGDIDGSELNVRLYQLKKKYTEGKP